MTSIRPDKTSQPRQHRLRAALGAALLPLLAALLVLTVAAPSDAAAARKKTVRLVEPTSVTVASTTCTDLGDGTWDVTVGFLVAGGRYLNLGTGDDLSAAEMDRDNVRAGGARLIETTTRYVNFPGYADDHSVPVTDTFTYQHLIAPIAGKDRPVSDSGMRFLVRDFEVSFTCA